MIRYFLYITSMLLYYIKSSVTNFKDFFFIQINVQEMDGNFHKPKLHIEGEDIRVFAFAVADTAYFYVIH
jgi:hypothetical protein